jgi:hypothetical protein
VVKKRSALDDKLSGAVKPKGWTDIISGGTVEEDEAQPPVPEPVFAKKTYLLRPAMVDEIAALAKEERVQVNELVRFLLASAIHDLKTGKLQIKATTEIRRIVS